MCKRFFLFLLVSLASSLAFSALNRVYPLSATARLRMEAYDDAIQTIWNSTATTFMKYAVDGSTSEVTLSAEEAEAVKISKINEIADKCQEILMVLPFPYIPESARPWSGSCLQVINGNKVPVVCP